MINVEIKKQEIINFLNEVGPSLPMRISKKIELSPMFTSAILAELLDAKKIKTSSLKVGSSPLYLIPEQEQRLEEFSDNLHGVEKEAFLKLKQNKILNDRQQPPQIRVALRSIKDFASSFNNQGEFFWKYKFLPDEEFQKLTKQTQIPKPTLEERPSIQKSSQGGTQISEQSSPNLGGHTSTPKLENSKIEPIFEKEKPKPTAKKSTKTKKSNQTFLEEITPFLQSKQIQIIQLEEVNKKQVIATININSETHLLAAFNKKRITEAELLKIYRKAEEKNMSYYIIAKAEPTKKMSDLMDAYKKLRKIDVLE